MTQIFKVAGDTSFADPGNWNDAANTIQAIGHGGKGSVGSAGTRGGPGGGGGAFAMRTNVALLANGDFPVTLAVGAAGSPLGNLTTFNTAHTGREVQAATGADATTTISGAAGSIASSRPSVLLSGGNGATAGGVGGARPGTSVPPGAGGGGAGGPNGAGSVGGAASATTGGNGGNADGSAVSGPAGQTGAGVAGLAGNSGTEFDATHGCGTGGSGGGTTNGTLGGPGGNYGGGGAGNTGNSGTAQNGAAGLLIITYTPTSQAVAATFAGAGSVTAAAKLNAAVAANFAGAGALAANIIELNNVTANFAGAGLLAANATLDRTQLSASLAGAGALVANLELASAIKATFAGAGAQSVDAGQLFTTGFETGDAALATTGAGSSIQSTNVHSGVNSLQQANTSSTIRSNLGAKQTALRWYLFVPSITAATMVIENPSSRLIVKLNANGTLGIQDFGSTLGLTPVNGTKVLAPNVYYEVALAFDLAAGGVVQVYINGIIEINTTHTNDVTGTPTTSYRIAGAASPNQYYYDDITLYTETLQIPPPVPGYVLALANWAGVGTLVANLELAAATTANFAGAGSLTAPVISGPILTAETLAGAGTVAADITIAISGIDVSADFTGVGALAVALELQAAASADLAGAGAVAAELELEAQAEAAFDGTGALSVDVTVVVGGIPISADFEGAGALAVALEQEAAISANFAGASDMQAAISNSGSVAALFAGLGTLRVDLEQFEQTTAILTGRGTLFADITRRTAPTKWEISADFAGAGLMGSFPPGLGYYLPVLFLTEATRRQPQWWIQTYLSLPPEYGNWLEVEAAAFAQWGGAGLLKADLKVSAAIAASFAGEGQVEGLYGPTAWPISCEFAGVGSMHTDAGGPEAFTLVQDYIKTTRQDPRWWQQTYLTEWPR